MTESLAIPEELVFAAHDLAGLVPRDGARKYVNTYQPRLLDTTHTHLNRDPEGRSSLGDEAPAGLNPLPWTHHLIGNAETPTSVAAR